MANLIEEAKQVKEILNKIIESNVIEDSSILKNEIEIINQRWVKFDNQLLSDIIEKIDNPQHSVELAQYYQLIGDTLSLCFKIKIEIKIKIKIKLPDFNLIEILNDLLDKF